MSLNDAIGPWECEGANVVGKGEENVVGKGKPEKSKKPRVSQILEGAARTYEERGAMYGDNYKLFGKIMMAMFPDGLVLNSEDDFNRFNMFTQCSGKLTRYAQMFSRGGHLDSAHDEIVYAAMLQELTELTQEVNAQKAKSHE